LQPRKKRFKMAIVAAFLYIAAAFDGPVQKPHTRIRRRRTMGRFPSVERGGGDRSPRRSPLWKPEKAPTRNLIVVQDVTERRRIQEENERRARQLTVLHETSVELTAELNQNALFQSMRTFAWKIER
jgi:hypothetical protein